MKPCFIKSWSWLKIVSINVISCHFEEQNLTKFNSSLVSFISNNFKNIFPQFIVIWYSKMFYTNFLPICQIISHYTCIVFKVKLVPGTFGRYKIHQLYRVFSVYRFKQEPWQVQNIEISSDNKWSVVN